MTHTVVLTQFNHVHPHSTKKDTDCEEKAEENGEDDSHCGSDSYIIGVQVAYFLWLMYLFIALGMTADAFFVPILVSKQGINCMQ